MKQYSFLTESKTEDVIKQIRDFCLKVKYGLVDPKTKKPWKETHNSTTSDDYDKYWRLQSPSELKKTMTGNCYDTTAYMRDVCIKKGIEYKCFYMTPSSCKHTHAFIFVKDDNNVWNWLEYSWTRFRDCKLKSKNYEDLLNKAIKGMENSENEKVYCWDLTNKYPKYGCNIQQFQKFCVEKGKQIV